MISPEELKYYSMLKLQKLFREKMGEWKVGDYGHDLIGGTRCLCSDKFPLTFIFPTTCGRLADISQILRLPLPVDPENQERGLWGMLRNFRDLYTMPEFEIKWKVVIKSGMTFNADTPTLALLKALAAQEGVEI